MAALQRAAELQLFKSEAVAYAVRGLGKFREFLAPVRVEQIQLLRAVGKAAQAYSQQAHSAPRVAMDAKQRPQDGKNVAVQSRGFRQSLCARVRIEACVAYRQRDGAGLQTRLPQPFAGFLRKMAEHGLKRGGVIGILAKRVVVGNRFRFSVDDKLVGVAASCFAVERFAPLAKDLLEF